MTVSHLMHWRSRSISSTMAGVSAAVADAAGISGRPILLGDID
jgi:hypothetical protein